MIAAVFDGRVLKYYRKWDGPEMTAARAPHKSRKRRNNGDPCLLIGAKLMAPSCQLVVHSDGSHFDGRPPLSGQSGLS
jgi:hypothetical protein